jgi:hypothetical protein
VGRAVLLYCEGEGVALTSTVVRRFVDDELGIDRAEQTRQTRRRKEEESKPELHAYPTNLTGTLQSGADRLKEVDDDGWNLLRERHPRGG